MSCGGVGGVAVGAAGGLGDAGQLLAGGGVDLEADGVDGQVDALLFEFAGDVAGCRRRAGVLAVGDQHDRARSLVGQRVGGGPQGVADRGVAGRDDRGDLGLERCGVQRSDRREGLDVGAAGGFLGVGGAGAGAVDLQSDLGLRRQGVDQAGDGGLGGVDPGAGCVGLVHRAGGVEHDHHRHGGRRLGAVREWLPVAAALPPVSSPRTATSAATTAQGRDPADRRGRSRRRGAPCRCADP